MRGLEEDDRILALRVWELPYALGYVWYLVGTFARAAWRDLRGDDLGMVGIDVLDRLSNRRGREIAARCTKLAFDHNRDFEKGTTAARKFVDFIYDLAPLDGDPDIREAQIRVRQNARALEETFGPAPPKVRVGSELHQVLFHDPVMLALDIGTQSDLSRSGCRTRADNYLRAHPEDEPAVEAIVAAVEAFGIGTAREAAEITAGGPLSDAEWAQFGPRWERAWRAIVMP